MGEDVTEEGGPVTRGGVGVCIPWLVPAVGRPLSPACGPLWTQALPQKLLNPQGGAGGGVTLAHAWCTGLNCSPTAVTKPLLFLPA